MKLVKDDIGFHIETDDIEEAELLYDWYDDILKAKSIRTDDSYHPALVKLFFR